MSNGAVVSDRAWAQFEFLNKLRSEGLTCPGTQRDDTRLAPLEFDCNLWRVSLAYADEVASDSVAGALQGSASEANLLERARSQGFEVSAALVAAGLSSADQTLRQMTWSQRSCSKLMNGDYRRVAVAFAHSEDSMYHFYWTQLFQADPADDAAPVDRSCYPEGYKPPEYTTASAPNHATVEDNAHRQTGGVGAGEFSFRGSGSMPQEAGRTPRGRGGPGLSAAALAGIGAGSSFLLGSMCLCTWIWVILRRSSRACSHAARELRQQGRERSRGGPKNVPEAQRKQQELGKVCGRAEVDVPQHSAGEGKGLDAVSGAELPTLMALARRSPQHQPEFRPKMFDAFSPKRLDVAIDARMNERKPGYISARSVESSALSIPVPTGRSGGSGGSGWETLDIDDTPPAPSAAQKTPRESGIQDSGPLRVPIATLPPIASPASRADGEAASSSGSQSPNAEAPAALDDASMSSRGA